MADLLKRVERVLTEEPEANGIAIFGSDTRLLADRDPLDNGGYSLVFLDADSEAMAWRPGAPARPVRRDSLTGGGESS